ncbi:hypothetical protein ACS0PU_006066 [Formica fusca]
MIITRSAVTAAATVTTTTTARWALLLKRDTHCRYYDNVDGQRRSTTTTALRSDAVSAMLSRDRGRRALHGNDSSNSTDRISSVSTIIALALPYYYYYYYRYYCKYLTALLVDDGDDLVIARIPTRQNDANADNSEALVTANSDDHLLNRQNGLRCCA